jgi:hypothetical protein
MTQANRCALGVSVHTGWAACVVAGGSLGSPRIDAREEIELLADPARFVFHRAAEGRRAEAERSVARARAEATERAVAALIRFAKAYGVVGCAIVASAGEMPERLDDVLGSHPRIHTAEGVFYRLVMADAAEACGLPSRALPQKGLEGAAAKALGVEDVGRRLAEVGRVVGRPWAKDQKAAALAAWVMLSRGLG